jgi:glycerophosphoryl diester phosphodiesterase
MKKMAVFFLLGLILVACVREEKVRIKDLDDGLKVIRDLHSDVNAIKVTYITNVMVFKVELNRQVKTVDHQLLEDIKAFLNQKAIQSLVRDYYREHYDVENLNQTNLSMHIYFKSENEEFAKQYYSLGVDYYVADNGSYLANFLKEWEGPFYDLSNGYN